MNLLQRLKQRLDSVPTEVAVRALGNGLLNELDAAAKSAPSATDTTKKDEGYRQRNVLVAALARVYPSGIRRTNIEGWSEDWHGCVYIDLPSGQISYHYHDSQAHLFAGLPPYTKEWDGHDKKTVEDRLLTITAFPLAVTEIDAPCRTCNDDPKVCATVPGLRHCEKAMRETDGPHGG